MKTHTPKYRIELTCVSFVNKCRESHKFAYNVKESGKPCELNAKKWRDGINKSILSGANVHLAKIHSLYSNVSIIEQKTGISVAQYNATMFETI